MHNLMSVYTFTEEMLQNYVKFQQFVLDVFVLCALFSAESSLNIPVIAFHLFQLPTKICMIR